MSVWRVLVAGRYRLCEPLGSGGMGRVWLARDEVLRRDVAIKEVVLPEGLTVEEREELRLRTLREARAAARLSHPNVIGIFDVVQTEEQPWIVMEFVRSRSLQETLREHGPISPGRAAEIGLALLSALRAAHAAGVLHRDVKPGNVLLAEDGRVVLTDFGLAVFDTGEGAVTRPGLVLGSPQYVAPERARDGVSTAEADLWSLGATLYAAVEGHAPYARDSAMATLTALATETHRPPERAGPLRTVLDGLLRRNPRHRMTGVQADQALRRILAGEPVARRRLVPRPRRPAPVELELAASPTVVIGRSFDGTTQARALSRPRGLRRPWPLVAALASVVLVGSGALWLSAARGGTPVGAPPGQPSTVASSAAGAAARGWLPCGEPAAGSEPAGAHPRSRRFALLPNWRWYDDPSGYSLAVPAGWVRSVAGDLVCFHDPDQRRTLAVERLAQPGTDLVGFWDRRAEELVGSGRMRNYAQVALETRDFFEGGADWEFQCDAAGGTRTHALARAFTTAPGQAYALYWVTPEFDWPAYRTYLSVVAPSFTPPT